MKKIGQLPLVLFLIAGLSLVSLPLVYMKQHDESNQYIAQSRLIGEFEKYRVEFEVISKLLQPYQAYSIHIEYADETVAITSTLDDADAREAVKTLTANQVLINAVQVLGVNGVVGSIDSNNEGINFGPCMYSKGYDAHLFFDPEQKLMFNDTMLVRFDPNWVLVVEPAGPGSA